MSVNELLSAKRKEFPEHLKREWSKAVKFESLSVIYLISAVFLMYLTLGSSQAMRAAWYEDMLSFIPPIVFLVSTQFKDRHPTGKFPYGFHRFVTIAFAISSVALLAMGAFLVYSSAMSLINQEHPTIGNIIIFGRPIWLGWLMIPALLWTGVPSIFLGRIKLRLSEQLHDKVLHTDGEMNAADWKTAFAAILGIIGIGFGIWWADAVAALFIGLDILRDGYSNVREAFNNLINSTPQTVDQTQMEPVLCEVKKILFQTDGVEAVKIRFREEGHLFMGEGYLVVSDLDQDFVQFLEDLRKRIIDLDWRIYEFILVPVSELPDIPDITDSEC